MSTKAFMYFVHPRRGALGGFHSFFKHLLCAQHRGMLSQRGLSPAVGELRDEVNPVGRSVGCTAEGSTVRRPEAKDCGRSEKAAIRAGRQQPQE